MDYHKHQFKWPRVILESIPISLPIGPDKSQKSKVRYIKKATDWKYTVILFI